VTGLGDSVLRARDALMPGLVGVVGALGAIGTVTLLIVRRSMNQPPDLGFLVAAIVAIFSGALMIWCRYALKTGRSPWRSFGALGVIHALVAAFAIRALAGPEMVAPITGFLAVYALAMALLMAWCARIPVRSGDDAGT
jgi:hypothetical protein